MWKIDHFLYEDFTLKGITLEHRVVNLTILSNDVIIVVDSKTTASSVDYKYS